MKKILLVALVTALISCGKDEDTTFNPNNLPYFKYKINGGAEVTADSAWWQSGSSSTGITVFTGGQQSFDINWPVGNDTNFTGAKQLQPGGVVYLLSNPPSTNSTSQILNVTNFENRFMTGNMQATTVGAATQIEASFNKLQRKR